MSKTVDVARNEAERALGRLFNYNTSPDGASAERDRLTVLRALRNEASVADRKASFLLDYLCDSISPGEVLLSDGVVRIGGEPHQIECERYGHTTADYAEGDLETPLDAIERDFFAHATEEAKAAYRAIAAPDPVAGEAGTHERERYNFGYGPKIGASCLLCGHANVPAVWSEKCRDVFVCVPCRDTQRAALARPTEPTPAGVVRCAWCDQMVGSHATGCEGVRQGLFSAVVATPVSRAATAPTPSGEQGTLGEWLDALGDFAEGRRNAAEVLAVARKGFVRATDSGGTTEDVRRWLGDIITHCADGSGPDFYHIKRRAERCLAALSAPHAGQTK